MEREGAGQASEAKVGGEREWGESGVRGERDRWCERDESESGAREREVVKVERESGARKSGVR